MKVTRHIAILISLFFISELFAQGPKEPNIAGFEPVDASDMVNLSSGDLTYVLPVLTVPSPEGGYPIALSYHAGIAMDQEASWVGLGWNLSSGAINRGVNGYPDDWRAGKVIEIFKDVGFEETYKTFGVSFTTYEGTSIGLNIAHSSNKGFGGSVSFYDHKSQSGFDIGVQPGGKFHYDRSVLGLTFGTSGIGVQYGFKVAGVVSANLGVDQSFQGEGFTASGAIGTGKGAASVGLGFGYNSKNGFSVGAKASLSKVSSVGISFDSSGINGGLSVAGIGMNSSIQGGINSGNYAIIEEEAKNFFVLPTPVGVLGLSYSKQYVKVFLNKRDIDEINGALYFQDATGYTPGEVLCDCLADGQTFPWSRPCPCLPDETVVGQQYLSHTNSYMDIYEVGINNELQLDQNNISLPAYDNFSVTSQGLSGNFSPKRFKTAHLLGLKKEFQNDGNPYTLDYNLSDNLSSNLENITSFGDETFFTFDNEYSTSLLIAPVSLKTGNFSAIHSYINTASTTYIPEQRKLGGNFIEVFVNSEINSSTANSNNLMLPSTDTDRPFKAQDGIGAYKITAPDGKTYHYSLPVYARDFVSRTIGAIDNKPENESYFEKQQLKPYATHWLLTAITGPDYLKSDTTRNYPDEGDLGYWVRFDYGRWSDAAAWKTPAYEDYSSPEDDPNIKSVSYGTRQVYYLDKIKTRTHSALFVKNIRMDSKTPEWERKEFRYWGAPSTSHFNNDNPFILPEQYLLKLDKIILVKNEDDDTDTTSGNILSGGTVEVKFSAQGSHIASYHMDDKVLDVSDNLDNVHAKSIEIVDFGTHQDYSLVGNAPFSDAGRLTLNGLSFLGKGGASILPSYEFNYDNSKNFDWDTQTLWGYHEERPQVWSLTEILSPLGTQIKIEYEQDRFKPVVSFSTDDSIGPDANGIFTGGGLRVASVETTDNINSLKTLYDYSNPETSLDSGVMSYVPFLEDAPNDMPYGSQLPPPIPSYEYVTVHSIANNETDNFTSKSRFKFKVLSGFLENENSVSIGEFFNIIKTEKQNSTYTAKKVSVDEYTLENNFNTLGQILEVETFNKNGTLVSKTINEYASKDEIDQGITQESYQSYERVNYEDNAVKDQWNINTTTVKKYPSVLKSSTSYQGGLVSVSYYDKHDPITGQLLEATRIASDGKKYKSKSVPAYTIPEYSGSNGGYGMGSKIYDITNKNLLAQRAAQFTYLIDENNQEKIMNASISTWKNDWSYRYKDGNESSPSNSEEQIWRKQSNYAWKGSINGDGSYANYTGDYDNFDWTLNNTDQPSQWKKISETTRYDHYSLPLESTDINGNFASSKTVDNETKLGLVGNAAYTEMFASGAEYSENISGTTYVGKEVKLQSASVSGAKYHTGQYSIATQSGNKAFWVFMNSNEHKSGKYKISVWVYKSNYSRARINSGSGNEPFNGEKVFAGEWVQLNHYVDIYSDSSYNIYLTASSGTVYFDDFRLHPIQSSVATYVYNDLDELTYIIGANNMGINYEYNDGSNLVKTYVEVTDTQTVDGGFKLASFNDLVYQRALAEDDTGTDGGDQDDLLVYFDNYVPQSGSAPSTATLKGPQGTTVLISTSVSGPLTDSISAYFSASGSQACSPQNGPCNTSTQITIPTSGSISVSIDFNYQNIPDTSLDCAGIAQASLVTITSGPGTIDNSRKTISDQDNSCN